MELEPGQSVGFTHPNKHCYTGQELLLTAGLSSPWLRCAALKLSGRHSLDTFLLQTTPTWKRLPTAVETSCAQLMSRSGLGGETHLLSCSDSPFRASATPLLVCLRKVG